MPRLVVCLPCFNEEQALPHLFDELETLQTTLGQDWRVEALVVDDGSTDSTGDLASSPRTLNVTVITHSTNMGLGRALAHGLEWFIRHSASGDLLAVMDADLTHPPLLIPDMLKRMEQTKAGVVIASRYAPGGEEHGLSSLRRIYSRLASFMLGILAPMPGVKDYTCGYRLYEWHLLSIALQQFGECLIEERGFVCMAELLVKLRACGAIGAEVALKLHYERKAGMSKMNVPATIRRYGALGWRILTDATLRPARGG